MAKHLNFQLLKSGRSAKTISLHRNLSFLLLFTIFSFGASTDLYAQKYGNYLVFGNVHALVIYNSYEQQLTLSEKALLPDFAPFQILEESVLLSDNFSKAMRVGLEGRTYYVLLNELGKIKNLPEANLILDLQKSTELNDSLSVVRDNAVYLRSPNLEKLQIASGEKVLRILRYRKRIYGRVLSASTYGWITTARSDALVRVQQSKQEELGFSVLEIETIRNKVSRINNQIERLFIFFNQQSRTEIRPPRWQVTATATKIICFIDKNPSRFLRTGNQLRSEFKSVLQRHPITISGQPQHFTIDLQNKAGL